MRLLYLIMNTKNDIFFLNIRNHYLMNKKQYLENIGSLTENSMINKVNEYEQTVMKNDKFNDPYELIIHRHLLIKTFEEINEELKKDNRQFRIDFDEDANKHFNELNYDYF